MSDSSLPVLAPVPIPATRSVPRGTGCASSAAGEREKPRRGGRGRRICMIGLIVALTAAVFALRLSPVFTWFHCGSADGCFSDSASAQSQVPGSVPSVRYNYASASCGAKIVWKKSLHRASGAQLISHASAVLDDSSEKYLYAACDHCGTRSTGTSQGCFWFVVELCQPIKVDAVSLQTKELFAAYPKEFFVQGSFTFVVAPSTVYACMFLQHFRS